MFIQPDVCHSTEFANTLLTSNTYIDSSFTMQDRSHLWSRYATKPKHKSHDNILTNSLIINITKYTFHLLIKFLFLCPLSNHLYMKIHKLNSNLSSIRPCVYLSLYWNIADWSYLRRKSYGQQNWRKHDKETGQNTESEWMNWVGLHALWWEKYMHVHFGLNLSEKETT